MTCLRSLWPLATFQPVSKMLYSRQATFLWCTVVCFCIWFTMLGRCILCKLWCYTSTWSFHYLNSSLHQILMQTNLCGIALHSIHWKKLVQEKNLCNFLTQVDLYKFSEHVSEVLEYCTEANVLYSTGHSIWLLSASFMKQFHIVSYSFVYVR